jgi:hypothetical protein
MPAPSDVAANRASQLHRARAPFFERSIVEKRIRIRVQNLVTERRRLRRVDRDRADLAGFEAAQHTEQAVEIHRFMQAVVDRFAHQHVIGDANRSGEILGARGLVRKDRRDQVIGAHAQQLRRHFAAAAHPQDCERADGVPAPTRRKHRRRQERLRQHVLDTGRLDVFEDDLERKRVLVGEREHDAVVGRRGLQFQIERTAEALAKRQAPRAIDARAERRVQDELHPSGFVEESLGDDRAIGRNDAENRFAGADVGDRLICSRVVEPAVLDQELTCRCIVALVDRCAYGRDFTREFDRSAQALAVPKGHRRRCTLRIFDPHDAGFDAANSPRRRPEHEDITRQALDGEIFIERSNFMLVGLDHDVVGCRVGNRAARRDRGQARAAPCAQPPVDAIEVQVRAAASARRRNAVGEHVDDVVKVLTRQCLDTGTPFEPCRITPPRPTLRLHTRQRSAAQECRAAKSGIVIASSAPVRIARTSAAHSSNSSRVVGNSRPWGRAPIQ